MPSRLISHYRVVRRLGAGGMGEVFLAQDTQLERPVALKVMSAELARDPNQRKRFHTEAKAASGLSHPNICVIHEVGETEDKRPFLAMEYVEGQTLDIMLRQRRLRLREVVNLGMEAAEALEAAHTRGLVHRDIKPGNLMLDRRGQVKVMDFGLAKWFAPDALTSGITSAAQTRTDMLIGTPQYMSPEQALGRALDPRTDIFSLGVVLYELVAGQRPFLGHTVAETINNIINQPPAPLGLENPVFSPALDNIIFKCLEKEPEKRYASAKDLAADLRKLKEDSERALAMASQERTPAPATPSPGERQPTALWKLPAKAGAGQSRALGWTIGFVVVALLAVAGGWKLFRAGGLKSLSRGSNATLTDTQKSVAVLPFANLSADTADEYLSDGMTEEVLNVLARVKGLRVPARTSCFVFKGKTDDIQKIGRQLHVGAVLEGSLRKAGSQLRITTQLINVADGFHLWSESYDRDMTNIFAIQSDIATRVADALKVQLLGAAPEPTGDIEAYKLYWQGRYLWNRRTVEDIRRAIGCFNQAIAVDPKYALAYAGLADAYVVLPDYDIKPPSLEAEAKAREAALKALELKPQLAAAVTTLACCKSDYDWDWPGATAGFRRAIELDPNYPTARQWYAEMLCTLGRSEEALREVEKALELDPLSPVIQNVYARALVLAGRSEEAVTVLRKQIASDPSLAHTHSHLGYAYVSQGRLVEAIAEYEAGSRLSGWPAGDVGFCYARTGRIEDAKRIVQQLLEFQSQGGELSADIALVHHGLGNEAQAFEALERAVDEHPPYLSFYVVGAFWSDARSHPRFQAVLKKMNLAK